MEEEKEETSLTKKEQKKKRKEEKRRKKETKKTEKKEKKTKKKEVVEEIEKEETKKKKKKVHLKKKGLIIPLLLLILILLGIGGFFGYKEFSKTTVKKIKKAYSEKVLTNKRTKLYDQNKKEIGTIKKGFPLELEKVKTFTIQNKYLKIKDTHYYISYKDIKKQKEQKEEEKEESYYLPLDKKITSKKEIVLFEEKKEAITLKNGLKEALIERMDDDNYYIQFLNQTLRVPKSKNIKEIKAKENNTEKKADHVSVIYYERIDDGCTDNICLKSASLKAHLTRLKGDGYYTIPKEDFIAYINGNINLKEKAVFIATNDLNDQVKKINEELKTNVSKIEESDGIKLSITNKTAHSNEKKDSVNAYQAKRYTIIDDYTKMAEGADVIDNGNTLPYNQGIAVLNYHFFYDVTKGEYEWCKESICLEREKFKEHLQWFKDNNYKTLTIHEFADWYEGIIEVPEKSVLITIDDGARGTGKHNGNILIPLLEEYKLHATLFLIAGWWDISNYQSPYLDVQSHTFNLHYEASCADGRGMVACSDYATVKQDLQQSLDVIRDKTSFCFPFYSSDRESLQAIDELGFRVAFVGGSVKARRTNNRLLIPRYPIMDDVTLNDIIAMVS